MSLIYGRNVLKYKLILLEVWLNWLRFGIHSKVLNFLLKWFLCSFWNDFFVMNSVSELCKNQWIWQKLWRSNNMKVILCKFGSIFWDSLNPELWWLYSFFLHWFFPYGSYSSRKYNEILFSNFQKPRSNLHLCRKGPIILVLFVCPSVCLPVCPWCIFLSKYSVDYLNFFSWGYFAVYIKKRQSWILENVCVLDNWVNETNFDQKCSIWCFNEGNVNFLL